MNILQPCNPKTHFFLVKIKLTNRTPIKSSMVSMVGIEEDIMSNYTLCRKEIPHKECKNKRLFMCYLGNAPFQAAGGYSFI